MFDNYIRNILLKVNKDLFFIKEKIDDNSSFRDEFPMLFLEEMDDLHKLIISLEDRRFNNHSGVDLKAIAREIFKYLLYILKIKKYKTLGGASTIDMQLVRTLTGYKDRTIKRKLYEIFLAYLINKKYEKRIIINTYIRYAFFGSQIYGLSDVIYVFNREGSFYDLDKEQKSLIAAFLQKPKPLYPTDDWLYQVKRRADYAIHISNILF